MLVHSNKALRPKRSASFVVQFSSCRAPRPQENEEGRAISDTKNNSSTKSTGDFGVSVTKNINID